MSIVRKEPLDGEKYVRISKEAAADMQWNYIYSSKSFKEVWPFTYGVMSLGITAAMTSLYIVGYYRRVLKLKDYARISMNLQVASLPAVIVPMMHHKLVSEAILLQDACPVCIQLRSILIGCSAGVLYPMLLAPLTGFMYSTLFATYPLPLLKWKNAREFYSVWKKITLPLSRRLPTMLGISLVVSAAITEFEAHHFFRMQEKIATQALDHEHKP